MAYQDMLCDVPLDWQWHLPGYLFDGLQFGRSARLFNLILPSRRTSTCASSFFDQGAVFLFLLVLLIIT
jgi:hypothetical protein